VIAERSCGSDWPGFGLYPHLCWALKQGVRGAHGGATRPGGKIIGCRNYSALSRVTQTYDKEIYHG
jgi:hypothetical protein